MHTLLYNKTQILNQQKQIQQILIHKMDQFNKVKLRLRAKELTSPFLFGSPNIFMKVLVKNGSNFEIKGKTQVIPKSLQAEWQKYIQVQRYFECQQVILFEVHHEVNQNQSTKIAKFEMNLGNLMGSPTLSVQFDLKTDDGKPCGKGDVSAQIINPSDYKFVIDMSGIMPKMDASWMNLYKGLCDPFLRFYKQLKDKSYILVKETNVMYKNLTPKWQKIQFPIFDLFVVDHPDSIFKLQCLDYQQNEKHQYIGEVNIKLSELNQLKPLSFTLKNDKIKEQKIVTFEKIDKVKTPHFATHLKDGLKLNMVAAVDFTASNVPTDQKYKGLQSYQNPSSLHYLKAEGSNHYQRVLKIAWDIIQNYDNDRRVPALGFGGKPHYKQLNENVVNHCFPMSGSSQEIEVKTFQRLMEVYELALHNVQLSGPTKFEPLIQKTSNIAKLLVGKYEYLVVLILTDGMIEDIQETMNVLVENAHLPMSFTIVGIGSSQDFQNMYLLNDKQKVIHSNGTKCSRDIVHFTQFNKMSANTTVFTKQILHEVPEQVEQYYRIHEQKNN